MNRVVYFKKSPSIKEKRVSFAVVRKEVGPDGKVQSQKSIVDAAITALNAQLMSKALTYSEVDGHIDDLIRKLNESERKKRQGQWVANSENQKLLEKYWEDRYGGTKIRRPETARRTLQRAINLIGPVSLLAPKRELQAVVDKRCEGHANNQRRISATLNEMRSWFGLKKADRINREPKPPRNFTFHTKPQFEAVVAQVASTSKVSAKTYQALFRVLFFSGARTGEAYAFKAHMRIGGKLKIHTQIDRWNKEVPTKNNTRRTTILFDEAIPDFDYWLTAPDKDRIDRTNLARIWKKACKLAFPTQPNLWTTVHALRHSYAVLMMTVHGQRLEVVAKLLGDTVAVCEEYYLGFEQNDDLLDGVIKAIEIRNR